MLFFIWAHSHYSCWVCWSVLPSTVQGNVPCFLWSQFTPLCCGVLKKKKYCMQLFSSVQHAAAETTASQHRCVNRTCDIAIKF